MRTYDSLDKDLPHLGTHLINSAEPKELAASEITCLIFNLLAKVEWIATKRIEIKTSLRPQLFFSIFLMHEIMVVF